VLYVSKFGEAVYVLHVFEKKSRKTSALDLAVGEARYRELFRLRKSR
jgi:phage-related protein